MAQRASVDVPSFPLTALVGCGDVIDAIACALCSPDIRTVLITGPAGTGKTVAARGAAAVSKGLRAVELPLNATSEQVFGTIDMDEALSTGRREVTDSVMRRADGNILIADNFNLLPKGLAHSVLDAVTTGSVRAEMDGASVDEGCDTVLIATMDPREAELDPHELDRFDICVRTETRFDPEERAEVLRRSLRHSMSPSRFSCSFSDSQDSLADRISGADPRSVRIPEELLRIVPMISESMGVEGHRGDIAVVETARALAALDGEDTAGPDHLRRAVRLCLTHRSRVDAAEDVPMDVEVVDIIEQNEDVPDISDSEVPAPHRDMGRDRPARVRVRAPTATEPEEQEDVVYAVGRTFRVTDFIPDEREMGRDRDSGRRGLALSKDSDGRCIGYTVPRGRPRDVALGATIRMAAPHQTHRSRDGVAIAIEDEDIRERVRVRRKGTRILFVVDGSGSMGAERRMVAVKGAIMSILEEAYRRRDMVGLVVFRGERAGVVLPMTRSVSTARAALESMPVGGKTPLVSGLRTAYGVLRRYAEDGDDPVMVVLTDGWGNVGIDLSLTADEELRRTAEPIVRAGIRSVVIDIEPPGSRLRRAPRLAAMLRAPCMTLEEMDADRLSSAVMSSLGPVDGAAKEQNTQ